MFSNHWWFPELSEEERKYKEKIKEWKDKRTKEYIKNKKIKDERMKRWKNKRMKEEKKG